ncbi:MAG TPA: hypothetical protein VGF45_10685, partial [Polyangia bacterium]
MKADRSSMVTAFAPSILPTRTRAAGWWASTRRSLPVLATALFAVLAVAPGCRSVRPPPTEPGLGGMPAGQGGSGGGNGGRGGSGGSGGSGGMTTPDAPVDLPVDMAVDLPPACGLSNQPCCPGNVCGNGGCCELGMCTSYGQGCRLAPGHSCIASRCAAECGGLNMKCCSQRNCTAPYTTCEGVTGNALGTCVACGGAGQPCCANGYCGEPGVCRNNRCSSS